MTDTKPTDPEALRLEAHNARARLCLNNIPGADVGRGRDDNIRLMKAIDALADALVVSREKSEIGFFGRAARLQIRCNELERERDEARALHNKHCHMRVGDECCSVPWKEPK